MTQIIGTITRDYALLASDRRLTFISGPRKGQPAEDDECKLVNLCNICGIGYTGLARIEEMPTHEWIGKRLAEQACCDPGNAAMILRSEANRALAKMPLPIEHSFLSAGWGLLQDLKTLRPHFRLVTNVKDAAGQPLDKPGPEFNSLLLSLKDDEDLLMSVIGQPLTFARGKNLDRYLRRLVKHEISPKQAMLALVDEISFTATAAKTVGARILCLCIPRVAAQHGIFSTEHNLMIAKEPDLQNASFCYFDPDYSELRQYGPTFVCGEMAVTDVVTESDPKRDYQSSSVKILNLPKPKTE